MVGSSIVEIWSYCNQIKCGSGHHVTVGKETRDVVSYESDWCLSTRESFGDHVGRPYGMRSEHGCGLDYVPLCTTVEDCRNVA